MIHRLVTAYAAWQQRGRARAVHYHSGARGAYACTSRLCAKWAISADDAAHIGFE